MAKTDPKASSKPGEQTIDQLHQRYQALSKRKIQTQTKREAAQNQLEKLKADARQNYGTDDVGELKKKLQELKAENEQKRAKYQQDLDQIEQGLAEVEQKFPAADETPEPEDE